MSEACSEFFERMCTGGDSVNRPHAWRVIEIANEDEALEWKVNGAGGEGGSITILCNSLSHAKRAMIREIEQEDPLFNNIPIYLSQHGLRVWERDRKEEF